MILLRTSLALLGGAMALRASPAPVLPEFHLPAGPASVTLPLFIRQSGEQVIFFPETVAGIRTPAVAGRLTVDEALRRLLAGTALRAIVDAPSRAYSIIRLPEPGSARRSAAPAAQSPAEPVQRLPQFDVSGSNPDRYRAAEAVSLDRVRGDLLTTPLTVNVVTRALLDDVGADSLYDAVRYYPGVSNGRGAGADGIMDRLDFRGFESFTRTIDDFAGQLIPANTGFVAVFDPAFVERAEVVMGPDAILSPTGSPGGSMNILTKSPEFAAASTLQASVGSVGANRIALDSTGPLPGSDAWAYRFIADEQDARAYVPGSLRNRNVSGQMTVRLPRGGELTVRYFGVQWELTGAAANVNDSGWEVTDPASVGGAVIGATPAADRGFSYRGWNGDAPWSHTFDRVNLASATLTLPLGSHVTARLGAQALFDNNVGDSGYPAAAPTEIFDAATGQVTGLVPIDPASLPEVARFNHVVAADGQIQNDLAGSYTVGNALLEPVAGWSAQRGRTDGKTTQAPLPPADLDLPYAPPHPAAADYALSARTQAQADQEQAFALVRAGFFDRQLIALAGLSRTWIQSETTAGTPAAGESRFGLSGGRNAYLAALLLRATDWLSLYYTRSTNTALTAASNQPLWQQGRQDEIGGKAVLPGDRLAVTVSHFDVRQHNIATPNPLYNIDPARYPAATLSDQANHGVEANASGGLSDRLSAILSWTEMRFRDPFGRRVRNVPDRLCSAFLRWRLGRGASDGAALFAGVLHTGSVAGENPPNQLTALGVPEQVGFYLPAWTVANAGASFTVGRARLRLNVDNLLNTHFGWQPASRLSVSPYPGTAMRLSADWKF